MEGDVGPMRASYRDSMDQLLSKLENLSRCLKNDIQAADLKWSLFVAGTQSYRNDTCLRPFPPQFMKDDEKDIQRLQEVLTLMPSLHTLLSLIESPLCSDLYTNRAALIDLVHWVLIEQDEPLLSTVPKKEFTKVLSKCPGKECAKPNYIFEVKYSPKNEKEVRFRALAKDHGTLFAYHGSRLENFYSILNYGLLKTLNKKTVYGQGVYLASELLISLQYSATGYGWGGSMLGSEASCVALCEIIDHPDLVCQSRENEPNSNRNLAEDSTAGEIPHKHYLAKNTEHVQVRYLLVYAENPHSLTQEQDNRTVVSWLKKHKMLTILVGYVMLLTAVGISNNPSIMRYYRMLLRRWGR